MLHRTIVYVLFSVVASMLLACGESEDDSSPVGEPLISSVTTIHPPPNMTSSRTHSLSTESETTPDTDPTPIAEIQVIPTSLPVPARDLSGESKGTDANPRNTPQYGSELGSYYNPYFGEATLEERIAVAEVIAIARMVTVATGVEEFEILDHTGEPTSREEFVGVLRFTFNVSAYLKNSGTDSPSQLTAVVKAWHFQLTREDAQAVADQMLAKRNMQWDNRDAVIFLVRQHGELPVTNSDNVFYMSVVDVIDRDSARGDQYSIASKRNKIWLPEADRGSSGQSSSERWFLTDVPATTSPETPAIAQSELVREINRVTAEMNADPRDGYATCITYGYFIDREDAWYAAQGHVRRPEYFLQEEIGSGLPTGTDITSIDFLVVNEDWKERSWIEGDDADLFTIGDVVRSWESVGFHYPNSFDAIGGKFLVTGTLNRHNIETTRPLPKGEYAFVENGYGIFSTPCEHYKEVVNWTVTVTAPDGVLHEAFFDPVTDGTAIAADASNGILKPTTFIGRSSVPATIERIGWESGRVKIKVTPEYALSGQTVDFIALDGSVSLSLDVADAKVDAANGMLSLGVLSQPWEDGDKLMVRIRESRQ